MDVISKIYARCSLQISKLEQELESQEYQACRYEINGLKIISRASKITPKKIGQFVTFWKRNENGISTPQEEHDPFDFYVINVFSGKKLGQFIFPKSILITKGIVSTKAKDGKRGFRVYPIWDHPTSKQALKTQKWQLEYFVDFREEDDLELLKNLLQRK